MKVLLAASRLYSVTEKISSDTYERFDFKSIPDPPGFEELVSSDIKDKTNRIISVSMWDIGRNPFFSLTLKKFFLITKFFCLVIGGLKSIMIYLQDPFLRTPRLE